MADVFKPAETASPSAAAKPDTTKAAEPSIPKALERYVVDGKLDVEKIAQSLQESDQKLSSMGSEKAAIEQAYRTLIGKGADTTMDEPAQPASKPAAKAEGRSALEELVTDPDRCIQDALSSGAAPIVQAVVQLAHPEVALDAEGKFKNPKFVEGLRRYAATLPPDIRAKLETDFVTGEWVIRQFKQHVWKPDASDAAAEGHETTDTVLPATGGGTVQKRQVLEPASSSKAPTGGVKQWTKAEVDALMRKPKEYAKVADEISLAYAEGRVK